MGTRPARCVTSRLTPAPVPASHRSILSTGGTMSSEPPIGVRWSTYVPPNEAATRGQGAGDAVVACRETQGVVQLRLLGRTECRRVLGSARLSGAWQDPRIRVPRGGRLVETVPRREIRFADVL